MASVGKFWDPSGKSKLHLFLPGLWYPLQFQSPEWEGLIGPSQAICSHGASGSRKAEEATLLPAKAKAGEKEGRSRSAMTFSQELRCLVASWPSLRSLEEELPREGDKFPSEPGDVEKLRSCPEGLQMSRKLSKPADLGVNH